MIKPPTNLLCEYLYNPIGIDTQTPRFSWNLEHEERTQFQSAYQIIMSSDKQTLISEKGDLWDTGKIKSEKTINIYYTGKSLKSNSVYYWRVKWWDKNDTSSDFSEIAKFETALLEESDWQAK
ncbi:MAG: alpha-L-rhamnosidase, partial [Candidatus Hermodarchaeota archaeon]